MDQPVGVVDRAFRSEFAIAATAAATLEGVLFPGRSVRQPLYSHLIDRLALRASLLAGLLRPHLGHVDSTLIGRRAAYPRRADCNCFMASTIAALGGAEPPPKWAG